MGKGQAPQPHTPIEAPNTLRSRSVARLVDLISEGEIEGLVNGLQSIYLDDTPLQNADGTFNFSNMTVDTRPGTPDQTPMPGFPAVESEVSVGVEVRNVSSVTRSITNPDANAARITIRLDGLQAVNPSTGDVNPSSVQIAIDVRQTAGPWVEVVTPAMGTISGKTSSAYQRAFRVERPAGGGDWDWRVRRITADNASSTLVNKTYVDSYTIVEDYQLSYPHSALIGYQVDAESFGGRVPKRLAHVNGIKTRIPSNYNPLTRAYTGIWDGTFQTARHSNPAWALFECIANDRWGVGDFVPEPLRDKWTLYSIGQYCDELVPDGKGGWEPRYKFDWAIASAAEALKVLMSIASVFRGMIYWGSSGITASADRDLDPSKLVVAGNVIGGLINWGGGGLKARHTVAIVTFYDPDDFCRPTTEVVEGDPADIVRWGYNTLEVVAVGCTSRGQAHRMGRWALESESSESETCSWQASFDHADTYPGEIAEIQDPAYAGVEFGGRVADLVDVGAGPVGIVVDRPITLEGGKTYTLNVTLSDGTVAVRPVTTGPSVGATLSFDIPLTPPPVINAVWVLTASDVAPRRVKIIKRVESTKANIYDLSGILHDPTKFTRIEDDLHLEPPSYTALPSGPIVAPTNLSFLECLTLVGGTVRSKVIVSWSPSTDPRVINYEVQVKPPGENWQPAAPQFSSGASIDLLDLPAGIWGLRVRALDGLGRTSTWLFEEPVTLAALETAPGPVTNERFTFISGRSHLLWDNPVDYRPINVEIRKGSSFESAQTVASSATSPWQTVGDDTYWITTFIVTSGGDRLYSLTKVSIAIEGSVNTENVVVSHDERAEGWTGYFAGTVGKDSTGGNYLRTGGQTAFLSPPDFLARSDFLNEGGQAGGYYWSRHVVNIGRKGLCRISNDWTATGVPEADDFLAGTTFLTIPDFLSGFLAQYIRVRPVLRISDTGPGDAYTEDNVFEPDDAFLAGTDWKDPQVWSPDVYGGWLFQLGMQFEILPSAAILDPRTIAYLLAWTWTIDVPDRLDSYQNLDIPLAGLVINFRPTGSLTDAPFNGGLNNETLPHVTTSIQNPTAGDEVVWEELSLSSMRLFVKNGGVKVARTGGNVNALVRGY